MINYLFDEPPASGEVLEIQPGILWLRMPLPLELDHINLYLLRDGDGWWVVDSGIALGPTEALWEQVFEQYLDGLPIKAVLATHYHPDHIGMAGWLCERWQCPFYMTFGEYYQGLAFERARSDDFTWTTEQHMRRGGHSDAQIAQTRESYADYGDMLKPMPTAFHRLSDGAMLTIDGHRWQVVIGRGHSPEHACLYSPTHNILISGDQVIPRITSNVSVSSAEPEGNPLKEWLHSHEHFLEVLPADALVMPAHNMPFYGLHHRLRALIEHHEDHLLALEQACAQGTPTAIELLPVLFQRELKEHHIGLAAGECVAHLNYLLHRGQLERFEDDEGRYRYRSVDDTLPSRLRQRPHDPEQTPPLRV